MPKFSETSESLIVRVRDPSNQAAWDQFEQLYCPVIFRTARAKGLQHSDALDLVQQASQHGFRAVGPETLLRHSSEVGAEPACGTKTKVRIVFSDG